MPQQSEINALLRFLTQDAKLALPNAMIATKALQAQALTSASLIAASNLANLTPFFASTDDAKKVFNASKRVSKRAASGDLPSPRKKQRVLKEEHTEPKPDEVEAALALPDPVTDVDRIASTILFTNRAPLLLVFTLVLLQYTMPRQPLSSRLSLAQAQVSQGAKARARDLGIEKGPIAEEDGWGTGQPVLKVMSKDIRVIRRHGYPLVAQDSLKTEDQSSYVAAAGPSDVKQSKPSAEAITDTSNLDSGAEVSPDDEQVEEAAVWALDLEALKKANSGVGISTTSSSGSSLPIYSPQSAKAYIMKAFAIAPSQGTTSTTVEDIKEELPKPKKAQNEAKRKEDNLGLLLGALELLYQSWADSLESSELSRRAWSWYGTFIRVKHALIMPSD